MSEHINKTDGPPADVELMLRAHAETRCLSREVIPVVRQIETGAGLPQEQYGAAMAYLEVTWLQARRRARESDAAYLQLCVLPADRADGEDEIYSGACRYYTAVKALREVVQRRVGMLLDACGCMELRPYETLPRIAM